MNEVCKMCFGSGYLVYCIVPPKLCPKCKGKGTIKTKRNNSPIYWIKLIKRRGIMKDARLVLSWFSIIGVIIFFLLLLALSYVWLFIK